MNEPLFLGISAKMILGASVGSAIGMVLGNGSRREQWLRGISGLTMAYLGAEPAAKVIVALLAVPLPEKFLPNYGELVAITAVFFAVVGLVMCQAAMNFVTAFRDRADDFVDHRLDRDDGPVLPRRRRVDQDEPGEDERRIPDGPSPKAVE